MNMAQKNSHAHQKKQQSTTQHTERGGSREKRERKVKWKWKS